MLNVLGHNNAVLQVVSVFFINESKMAHFADDDWITIRNEGTKERKAFYSVLTSNAEIDQAYPAESWDF